MLAQRSRPSPRPPPSRLPPRTPPAIRSANSHPAPQVHAPPLAACLDRFAQRLIRTAANVAPVLAPTRAQRDAHPRPLPSPPASPQFPHRIFSGTARSPHKNLKSPLQTHTAQPVPQPAQSVAATRSRSSPDYQFPSPSRAMAISINFDRSAGTLPAVPSAPRAWLPLTRSSQLTISANRDIVSRIVQAGCGARVHEVHLRISPGFRGGRKNGVLS